MPKVKLLVLEGCIRCSALKNKLNFYGSKFEYVSCDGDNKICDYTEELSGCNEYPMAVVLDINGKITEIVHFTQDYDMVGKKYKLMDGVAGYSVYSIDQLVDYIIKL